MSLLYKPKEEQTIECTFEILKDKTILLEFYSDCGKFGTNEALCGFIITPDKLLEILKKQRDSRTE